MFLLVYLRRELRRRLRQTILVASGLALGIGLVITVTAISTAVRNAQDDVLSSLYGVGTDITVTQAASGPGDMSATQPLLDRLQSGKLAPGDAVSGEFLVGYGTESSMAGNGLGRLGSNAVSQIAHLPGVTAATGGIIATNLRITATIPASGGGAGNWNLKTSAFQVSGVDVAAGRLGPIASAQLTSGRTFATTDTSASAVLDAGFATAQKLAVGSTLTVAEKSYPVIGIVNQASGATPAEVYLPLSEVQKLTRMADDVNTIYIATKDSKAVPAVRDRIASLLPGAKVTSADNLAGQVSGSLSTAARLIDTVGRWLAIIVLLAAFALACLLTLAAVSRRANELGLLKALGWQIRRVIGQITGETLTQGLAGAVLGIGLGAGAIGIIAWVSPSLSAAVAPPSSADKLTGPCPGGCSFRNSLASSRNVNALTLSPHIDLRLVLIAVLLALAGGLVAGVFGGWRASRLPPAIALRRVD